MTETALNPPRATALPRLSFARWEPVLGLAGLAMALAMIPTAIGVALDPRLFEGVPVWLKPLKFEGSVALFWLWASWAFSFLPRGYSATLAGRYIVWASVLAGTFEVVYIAWRASLGQASHFNFTSPVTITLYALMGVGALTMTSTALVQGIALLRHPPVLPAPLQRALGWGLILTFVLGSATGGYMSTQGGHFVGVPADSGGLPLLGWSTSVGDLRPPHFFGMHAAQILPLIVLGLMLLAPRRAAALVTPVAAAYALLTVAVFIQAVAGLPLIALA